jgi:oligopeptide transport system substrate-binding protein
MNLTRKLSYSLLVMTILLSACQAPGSNTPESSGSVLTNLADTAVASLAQADTYTSQENGVSVHYPPGWTTQTPSQGDQSLVIFLSPDQSIQAHLFVFPAQAEDTAQSVIQQNADSILQGLDNIIVVSDAALPDTQAASAWSRVFTAASQDTALTINLATYVYGTHAYLLLVFGSTTSYDNQVNTIAALLKGMQFSAPVISGVNRNEALFLAGGESTNPRDYDPATAHDSGDKRIFSGLVSLDAKLNLAPELAESWDISEDGKVYTFHLRPDAKFQDGKPVTTADVIYSWERAADPATQSDTVLTYLGDIVGVADMHAGKAQHISGLKALDDHSLQVSIDAPKPYFLYKLTMPVAFVLDKKNVDSGSDWYRTPNGTGPYHLDSWESFKQMIYSANQNFYLGTPAIKQIVIQLYSGPGISLYETGDIDITGVSVTDVPRVLDPADPLHPDLVSGVSLCTDYVIFDVTKPPFDDIKVRQAFSMAFDRQKFIDVVQNGVGIPAKGLYPPALPGYNLKLQGLPYDPAQARQLLAESKYGGPQGLPPIVYSAAGIGTTAGADVAAMAQMWEQNLGVRITIENLEPDKYYDLLYSGKHGQIFSGGWCADYPDPENFSDVLFHSGAQQNIGNYSNPALDAILDQARTEQDVSRRIGLYQQAEQLIVQEAPALFISHYVNYVLVKPYVKGYVLTPIDIPIERYLSLQH